MSIDAEVDLLFARVVNSPLFNAFLFYFHGETPYLKSRTAETILIDLLESGTKMANLPPPIKDFCDVCEKSFDAVKKMGINISQISRADYGKLYPVLLETMPEANRVCSSSEFTDYMGIIQ